MTDFVCVGDATQDIFFFISESSPEATVNCDLRTDSCELALKYGQKIPIDTIGLTPGGNACNVSAGLAKLGLTTKLLTSFGDDERGVWVKRELMRAGVDIESSKVAPGRQSNLSGIVVYKKERTILTFHPNEPDIVASVPDGEWLYLSSSAGRDSEKLHKVVLAALAEKPQEKLAFNPAVPDLERGQAFLAPVLKAALVLVLNWEEGEMLLSREFSKSDGDKTANVKRMILELVKLGPKIVVITDGPSGAYAGSADKSWHCRPADFACLEPTGAGDAFSSGFLAGLHYNNMDISQAMRWGSANSGSVITKVGGQAGLLSKRDVEEYLAKHPELSPVEI